MKNCTNCDFVLPLNDALQLGTSHTVTNFAIPTLVLMECLDESSILPVLESVLTMVQRC